MKQFSATSLLFVSAATPGRFSKARASGAGLVCIDLEDSVPPNKKDEARAAALAEIDHDPGYALRINPLGTVEGARDLAALAGRDVIPCSILLPKTESARDIEIVRGAVAQRSAIIPLVETPHAIGRTAEIASAAGVTAIMFGGGDLAGELGVELAWEPLLPARGAFLLGCAAAGVPAIDVPYLALDDAEGLKAETHRAAALGFAAKAAIHPGQIAVIDGVMLPSAALLAEAYAAEATFADAGGAAVRFRGRMLEAPVMRRYRRIIAQDNKEGTSEHA